MIEIFRALPDDVTALDVLNKRELRFAADELPVSVEGDDPEYLAELTCRVGAIKNGIARDRPGKEVMRELREG